MSEIYIESLDRRTWLETSAGFQDHNYRQCWDYGQLLAMRRGARSHHVGIRRGAEVIGLADVRIKRFPLLGGIAYISGGPLVRRGDINDIERLKSCLKALRQQYVESEGLVLRIQGTLGDPDWTNRATECFLSLGFKASRAGREYRTFVLDLARPLVEIRSSLAQKWRNCLNKALRANPAVKVTSAVGDFDRFAALFRQFTSRKGFSVELDATFFRQLQERLPPAEAMTLAVIEVNGELLAGHLSTTLGDTCVYLLGATSDAALRTNAAYLLQWNVIERSHEKGVKWYDLGGIDPLGNPGVYHFKRGFGGVEVLAPGPFELAPDSVGGQLILQAERGYRRLKRRGKPLRQAQPVLGVGAGQHPHSVKE